MSDMEAHTCNPAPQEAEAENFKSEPSLGSCLRKIRIESKPFLPPLGHFRD